jgi:hypothetical protein
MFTSVDDGPGWALVMGFKITENACKQLADLETASPAVKLFAKWAEKAPVEAGKAHTVQDTRHRFRKYP